MHRMYWTLAVWDGQFQKYPHHGYGFESFALRLGCPHHDQKLVGTTAEKQTEVVLSGACHGRITSCSPIKRGFQPIVPNIWMHLVGTCYFNPTIFGNHNFNPNLWMDLFFMSNKCHWGFSGPSLDTNSWPSLSPGSKWFTALARVVPNSWGYYPLLHLAYHF